MHLEVSQRSVEITVDCGVVRPTRLVESYAQKWAIDRVVSRVVGVKHLPDHLHVRPPEAAAPNDRRIERAANRALQWDARAWELGTAETYLQKALAGNPDLRAAGARIAKARAGESAARSAYIPDVGAYGQYVHQSGVPFLPRDNFIFGVRGSWTIFDFGKRDGAVAERRAQLAEALEDSSRVHNRVESEVRKSWRKLERSLQMRQVAAEAFVARREATRLQRDTTQAGFAIEAQAAQARADQAKAEADLFAAELGVRLAWAGVRRAAGITSAAVQ
jgi:outer membrane protein TolC